MKNKLKTKLKNYKIWNTSKWLSLQYRVFIVFTWGFLLLASAKRIFLGLNFVFDLNWKAAFKIILCVRDSLEIVWIRDVNFSRKWERFYFLLNKACPGRKRLTDEEIATRDAAKANKKAIDKAARDAASEKVASQSLSSAQPKINKKRRLATIQDDCEKIFFNLINLIRINSKSDFWIIKSFFFYFINYFDVFILVFLVKCTRSLRTRCALILAIVYS